MWCGGRRQGGEGGGGGGGGGGEGRGGRGRDEREKENDQLLQGLNLSQMNPHPEIPAS